jgi:hypothetical protein
MFDLDITRDSFDLTSVEKRWIKNRHPEGGIDPFPFRRLSDWSILPDPKGLGTPPNRRWPASDNGHSIP